jgi:uncharacterized protein (DUF1330 family)
MTEETPHGADDDLDPMTVGYSLAFARNMIPAKMAPYSAALPPIYEKFNGGYVALAGPGRGAEHLAGDWGDRAIMLGRFPSYRAVADFWWSPEYRAAAEHRKGAVTVDVCRFAGWQVPEADEALLVLAFEPDAGHRWRATLERETSAGTGGCFVAPLERPAFEVLEGDLSNMTIAVLSFPDHAALRAAWAALRPSLHAIAGRLQAYAAPRVRAT